MGGGGFLMIGWVTAGKVSGGDERKVLAVIIAGLNNFIGGIAMIQLTENEVDGMVSQIAIPSKQKLGGHLPYAFTEHGVLMLANVLRSKKAIQVSLRIIEIFVKMREMLSTHKDVLLKLEQLEKKVTGHDADVQVIFQCLKKLLDPPREPRPRVGFRRAGEEN
jgi:hypothetical protein